MNSKEAHLTTCIKIVNIDTNNLGAYRKSQ